MNTIRVQEQDFDIKAEYDALRCKVSTDQASDISADTGAVVTFTGLVRDFNLGDGVETLFLEHYPGMTEKSLSDIAEQARSRWSVLKVCIIHRVGELKPGDQIVFVGVSSAHRGDAFSACEYIMDFLKTRAPFWKKEKTATGSRWVDARSSDSEAAARWSKN